LRAENHQWAQPDNRIEAKLHNEENCDREEQVSRKGGEKLPIG